MGGLFFFLIVKHFDRCEVEYVLVVEDMCYPCTLD